MFRIEGSEDVPRSHVLRRQRELLGGRLKLLTTNPKSIMKHAKS